MGEKRRKITAAAQQRRGEERRSHFLRKQPLNQNRRKDSKDREGQRKRGEKGDTVQLKIPGKR
jgi:hypothetical protein